MPGGMALKNLVHSRRCYTCIRASLDTSFGLVSVRGSFLKYSVSKEMKDSPSHCMCSHSPQDLEFDNPVKWPGSHEASISH